MKRNWRWSIIALGVTISAGTSLPARAQSATCDGGWSFTNLTRASSGETVTGTPSVLSWHQGNVGQRTDVFARNAEGDLVHYFRVEPTENDPEGSGAPYGAWKPENLSSITRDEPNLVTDPVAVLGTQTINNADYDRHDVFAVGAGGDLIHYWWSEYPPGKWHAENLTSSRPGVRVRHAVQAKPIVANTSTHTGLKTDVFSLDRQGQLIHYWWTRGTGWDSENLTQRLNAERFVADETLSVYADGSDYHVYGRSHGDELLHYYWKGPNRRWRFENTSRRGFQRSPDIGSATGASTDRWLQAYGLDISVFGFDGDHLVRYWSPTREHPWQAEDVTGTVGYLSAHGAVPGKPSVNHSRQFILQASPPLVLVRTDVFARDENDELVHYWAAPDWSAFSPSAIAWEPGENLTTLANGVPIRSDPVTSIRHSPYEHYVLSGDGRDVVLYCWSSSSGWRSTTLRAVSSPAGEPSSEAPAVDGWPTTLGVFAAASNGDLLFYEKH